MTWDEPTHERGASGLSLVQEVRMLKRAIKQGWLKGTRWATDATIQEIQEAAKQRQLTIKEQALITVYLDLNAKSDRARAAAVKATVNMERQNQIDDLAEAGTDGPTINIANNVGLVVNADERRLRLAAISERLGLAGVARDAAEGDGVACPVATGRADHGEGEARPPDEPGTLHRTDVEPG